MSICTCEENFYLEYFLEITFILINPANHTSTKPELGHDELRLAQPGVSHLLHQVFLVPPGQIGGRQWSWHSQGADWRLEIGTEFDQNTNIYY